MVYTMRIVLTTRTNLWRDFVPILTRCENRYAVTMDYAILSNRENGCILLIFYKIAKRVPLLKLSFVEKRRLERPTPTSRTWCATNCATSRSLKTYKHTYNNCLQSASAIESGCKVTAFFWNMQIISLFFSKNCVFLRLWERNWQLFPCNRLP